MDKKTIKGRVLRFFKFIYLKLFRINDTPQRIAIGCGLGAFFGVMPGMGPLVALFFAFILRMNRASALVGSVLTNTWLSIPTFFISAKIGSIITSTNYSDIYKGWTDLIKNFRFHPLFELSFYKIIVPIIVGYLVVSFFIAIMAYVIALVIIKIIKKRREARTHA